MTPEEIYREYPRKVGKRKAILEIERAMMRLRKGEAGRVLTEEQIFAGLMRKTIMFALSYAGQNFPFVPHPSTWYHQSRYLDDPMEWNRGKAESKAAAVARANTEVIRRVQSKNGSAQAGGEYVGEGTDRRNGRTLDAHPRRLLGGGS